MHGLSVNALNVLNKLTRIHIQREDKEACKQLHLGQIHLIHHQMNVLKEYDNHGQKKEENI